MSKELINQALTLFDTPEKWNAFVEMANHKEAMKLQYLQKAKNPLLKYFNENFVDGWVCEPWGNTAYDIRWYLKDFGKNSIALALGWTFHFILHVEDINSFDTNKINELLKSEYSLILSSFDRIDRQFENQLKVVEVRNYYFNSPFDSNFDDAHVDQFAWFVGNETDKFVQQIINKVDRFRKSPKLTQMIYELNQKSRIITE